MSEPDPTAGGSELEQQVAAETAALEERIANPRDPALEPPPAAGRQTDGPMI